MNKLFFGKARLNAPRTTESISIRIHKYERAVEEIMKRGYGNEEKMIAFFLEAIQKLEKQVNVIAHN